MLLLKEPGTNGIVVCTLVLSLDLYALALPEPGSLAEICILKTPAGHQECISMSVHSASNLDLGIGAQ